MSFSRHCPRYSEYQHLFPDTPRLQESLCNFHVVLVRCCIQTVQAIQRTGISRVTTLDFCVDVMLILNRLDEPLEVGG